MSAGAVSEKTFQAQVVKLAKLTNHFVYHTYDSRRSEAGFPDLVIVGPRSEKPLFVELKPHKRAHLSGPQKDWARLLRMCPGADYRLWTPDEWPEIEAELKGA